jgi:hypothetical protein
MFNFIKKIKQKRQAKAIQSSYDIDINQIIYRMSIEKNPRSPQWPEVRKEFLKENNFECACCKSKNNLSVHHKKPFHLFPELELDIKNLIVLCENKVLNCHYVIGHCFDWSAYNPTVEIDASKIQISIEDRLYK